MIAAVYARKSTSQDGLVEDAKSVTRQVEGGRAFAVRKGWMVDDAHVYVDDGISGAEFKRRPGFQAMLAAARRGAFTVLIVSEQKSIGREMSETGYVIKELALAGVDIFEYVHGQSLTPRNAMDKAMSSLRGYGDEAHREATAERVHESHARSTKAGHVTGGRVYGYRNEHVYDGVDQHGNPRRSHVARVVVPAEEAVVRRIFTLYDAGEGLKRIAKLLAIEGAPAPRPFVRRDPTKVAPVQGWSPSTVRTILMRELYHGVIVWNQSRKRPVGWGQVKQKPRPESEHLRTPAEHLRIIDEALWVRVQTRRQDVEKRAVRFDGGRISGRPPKTPTQNLLAGLATCALCGGGLVVETSQRKGERAVEYVCYRRRANGTCTNALRIAVTDLNEAVLQAVEAHALTPEAIEAVIQLSERDDVAEQQDRLERERRDVEKRIGRLVVAVEAAGDVASLAVKLRELEARRDAIDRELRDLRPVPRLAPAVIESRLAEWRRLLRSSTTQARTVLQRVIRGRLTFTPRADGLGYDFAGPTRFDKLFAGMAHGLKVVGKEEWAHGRDWVLCPDGDPGEHVLAALENREATEEEYGRLLDNVKGVTSPSGLTPFYMAGSAVWAA